MRNTAILTLAALAAIVSATPVHAANDTSYVEYGGFDGNDCSNAAAARCRTLATAIAKTNPGGIIYCVTGVDNGSVPTLFGPITIDKSITIDCTGTNTSISAAGAAITINAAATVVTLRGLRIHGQGAGGSSGINVTVGATVIVDDVKIDHLRASGSGIIFAPNGAGRLDVSNSFISDTGSTTTTAGILIKPSSGGTANVSISRTQLSGNVNGIFVDGSGGGGAVNLSVRDSVVTGSSNVGIVLFTPSSAVTALIDRTTVNSSLNVGVAVSGAAATARLSNSVIYGNVTGVSALSGATLRSYKNNQINGNLTDGTPITAEGLN